jgi:hypothetical protein
MYLDLLDENYPMVVSKLPFEQLDQAGITGWSCRSNQVLSDLPNSGVNNVHLSISRICNRYQTTTVTSTSHQSHVMAISLGPQGTLVTGMKIETVTVNSTS